MAVRECVVFLKKCKVTEDAMSSKLGILVLGQNLDTKFYVLKLY